MGSRTRVNDPPPPPTITWDGMCEKMLTVAWLTLTPATAIKALTISVWPLVAAIVKALLRNSCVTCLMLIEGIAINALTISV